MSILFFTKGDRTTGSSRQRVWFVAEELKRRYGYEYEILYGIRHTMFEFSRQRFRTLRTIYTKLRDPKYSIIFVHKSFFPWDVTFLILIAKLLFGKSLIFDLDDAVWLHSKLKSELLARHANLVLCGSRAILSWAEAQSKNAVLAPTVVHADVYAKYSITHGERDVVTIGWVGQGQAHFKDGNFHIIKPVLDALAKEGKKFRFVIVGSQGHQPLKDLFADTAYPVVFVDQADWANPEAVPELIKEYEFDIGIMPIVDTPFNRAKCAFKAIEYMVCGIPVVSSDVGEIGYLLENGKEGYIATTQEEWIQSLRTLFADASLRQVMGKSGQQKICALYSFDVLIPHIQKALKDASITV